eukprot:15471489-Alexandrium_andersonii.AAC.1
MAFLDLERVSASCSSYHIAGRSRRSHDLFRSPRECQPGSICRANRWRTVQLRKLARFELHCPPIRAPSATGMRARRVDDA